jgi:nicotinamidase-related amidase
MTDLPKTLLQFAGAPRPTPTLTGGAVVVIDAQEEYRSGRLPLHGIDAAVGQLASVLARARAEGVPILHIKQLGRPGGLFDPEGPTSAIMAECAPAGEEPVIDKKLPNAFAGTTLDAALREIAPAHLVIVGFMTHMCVSATTRAALDLGYASFLVTDAVATRDLPAHDGGVVPADQVHRATLAALGDRFATLTTAGELGA